VTVVTHKPSLKLKCFCCNEAANQLLHDVISVRRWVSVCWPLEWADITSPYFTIDLLHELHGESVFFPSSTRCYAEVSVFVTGRLRAAKGAAVWVCGKSD